MKLSFPWMAGALALATFGSGCVAHHPAKVQPMKATASAPRLPTITAAFVEKPKSIQPVSATPAQAAPKRRELVVPVAPPLPQVEVVDVPPSPDYVWIPGAWQWRKGQWTWASGYWAMKPRPESVWVKGRWTKRDDGWVWVPGSWR